MTTERKEPLSVHATDLVGPFTVRIPESGVDDLKATALACDRQNRIYVAAYLPLDYRFFLVRLLAEEEGEAGLAKLDMTFGLGGYVQISVEDMFISFVTHIVESAAGDRVTLGVEGVVGNATEFVLCRYLDNGHTDQDFGTDGVVRFNGLPKTDVEPSDAPMGATVAPAKASRSAVKGLASGQMLALVYRLMSGRRRSYLVKVNADGTLDSSFGKSAGYTELSFAGSSENAIYRLAVDADEHSVVVCENELGQCLAARYTPSGGLDTEFGLKGIKEFSDTDGKLHDPHVQIDMTGKIIISLNFTKPSTEAIVHLYRLGKNGATDPGFNGGMRLEITLLIRYGASALDVDGQGRIYVRGRSSDSERPIAVLSRCTALGLDPDFGVAGHLELPGGVESGDVAVQRALLVPNTSGVVTHDGAALYRAIDR